MLGRAAVRESDFGVAFESVNAWIVLAGDVATADSTRESLVLNSQKYQYMAMDGGCSENAPS